MSLLANNNLRQEVSHDIIEGYENFKITLFNNDNVEVGSFSIDGNGFNTGEPMSMSIHIDEDLQGKGLSRYMIKTLTHYIRENFPNISDHQLLFIDVDASVGFWEHIGMKVNRYYNSARDIEGAGYEKNMTFRDLENFGNGGPSIGGKSSKKKSSKKYQRHMRFYQIIVKGSNLIHME